MTSYQKAMAEAKAEFEKLMLEQVEASWAKVERKEAEEMAMGAWDETN